MGKHAIVIMSAPGEANPGDQGRMVHGMTLARDLRDAGEEVRVQFHGIGARWMASMAVRNDAFGERYGKLFDEIKETIDGCCDFCVTKRFGAGESAKEIGVETLSTDSHDHHTVAALILDGYQVYNF